MFFPTTKMVEYTNLFKSNKILINPIKCHLTSFKAYKFINVYIALHKKNCFVSV